MNSIDRIVDLLSRNGGEKTFVFTSEVVARSYLEACAHRYPGRAVFTDSAISWDTFRGKFTSYPGCKVRAVYTDRLLFVQQYFASGEAMKKLEYYSDSSYECSKPAYIRSIAKALPDMCAAFDPETMELLDKTKENAPEEMQNDLLLLVPAYKTYLENHALYEAALSAPDFRRNASDGTTAKDYVLVFPETFSDPSVLKALEVCRHIDQDTLELTQYNNSLSEIRGCMREIYRLLTSGTSPDEIAITCSDFDAYKPYLETEARMRDITLTFNSAMPLTSYTPGAFFLALRRVKEENYSFRSMKALLLDLRFPYKDRDILVSIIRNAVDCRCKDGPLENWIRKIKKLCNKDHEHTALAEAERLEEIDSAISNVVDCKDPGKLKGSIISLVSSMFEKGEWIQEKECDDAEKPEDIKVENERIFGMCLNELDNLSSHAGTVTFDGCGNLFDLFVDILEDKTYVPDTGMGTVNVYRYPVSAGLAVKYHFILGLTDSNSKLLLNPYPFLPFDTAKKIDGVRALEDSVISLYGESLRGGFSRMSSARESYSGADVIPTVFLRKGWVESVEKPEVDSFERELSIWEGKEPPKGEKLFLTQKQKDCFTRADEKELVFSNDPSFHSVPVPFKISVSRVKNFENCPYSGYAYCVLGLDDLKFEPDMAAAADVGIILHETLQRALEEDPKTLGSLNPERLKKILSQKIEEYREKPKATDSVNVKSIRDMYMSKISKIADCFVEKEKKNPDDYTLEKLGEMTSLVNEYDKSPEFTPEDCPSIQFSGRMDCILGNDEELAVIDLKKDASSHYGGTLDKCNLQVAVYSKMLEKDPKFNGKSVTIGAYYSFKDGKFKFVWPKYGRNKGQSNFFYNENSIPDEPEPKSDKKEFVEENYNSRVKELNRIIGDHDFSPKPKDNESCKNCPFYTLCRKGFQTV